MTTLTEGSKAPAFKAKDQNGNLVSLTALKGNKIILYFYPEYPCSASGLDREILQQYLLYIHQLFFANRFRFYSHSGRADYFLRHNWIFTFLDNPGGKKIME